MKRAGPLPYGTSPGVFEAASSANSLNQPVTTGRISQSEGKRRKQFPSPI